MAPCDEECRNMPARNQTMFYRQLFAFAIIALIASSSGAAPLVIVSHHSSPFVIDVAADASPAILAAAKELSDVIAQSTGVRLPVTSQRSVGPMLAVGSARRKPVSLEGIEIERSGRNILLGYPADRSAVYSVERFLEVTIGARWYTPDEVVLPHRDSLYAPDTSITEHPAFTYRDTDIFETRASALFDAHVRLNGVSCPDMSQVGGANLDFAGGENFFELVPPAKYIAEHPEYFSLVGGQRRTAGDAQLCLTNDDLFRIVVDSLIAKAKSNLSLTTLALSPNDAGDGACQCDRCKAADARFGGPAGTELDFVNRVAAAVDKALPGRHLKVMTLAYQYLEKPPLNARPADNVLICFCPIGACIGHGLQNDPPNQNIRKNLEGWKAITRPGNLYIWHYAANFRSFLQPVPDWNELAVDFKYYKTLGVAGVFVEGNYQASGEMNELRTWLIGKLLWNPRQPVWPLIDEFCLAYYGAAGSDIVQYLRALSAPLSTPGVHLNIYQGARDGVLTDDALRQADAALSRAESHATDDKFRRRVSIVRLSLREVDIERSIPGPTASETEKAAFRQKLATFEADVKSAGILRLREGASTDQYYTQLLGKAK